MEKPTMKEVQAWVLELHAACEKNITPHERKEQEKYAVMVQQPADKVFLSKMLDESSQIRDNKKLAKRIKVLVDRYGIPKFFNGWDTFLFKMYQSFGYHFDFIAIPIIKHRLRGDTSSMIIDEARPHLTHHLATRSKQHIGQNVNLLGEVVIGNAEADHRYHHYLEALESPDINYISVKISGIYAQTHALNYEESFPELVRRMSTLYQKAIDFPYVDEKGGKHPKFINLDMEEYKDSHLTLRVFKEALSQPQFKNYSAGIVIQAYLPDAYLFQTELLEFARERVKQGGAPLKMRLVKGANLEMEHVISSLRGWPSPILPTKTKVDANYLHILDRALLPENAAVLHVGVASHNLFTIAYAYLLSQRLGSKEHMSFEMLEGMANHLWKAQRALGNQVILYTPVVKDEHFLNAVSYLVRRLDENTGPDNFLTYSFNLHPNTKEWDFLQNQFEEAYQMKESIVPQPTRTQDRRKAIPPLPPTEKMVNEPDTDFDLAANQRWVEEILTKWEQKGGKDSNEATASTNEKATQPIEIIPLQIGDKEVVTEKRSIYKDRCKEDRVTVCEMSQADGEQIEEVLAAAASNKGGWHNTTLEERHRILYKAADNLAAMRGDLIGCMCAITGKTVVEGDVEVSEAVDYARFYTTSMLPFAKMKTIDIKAKGTILVISPWNFPCAIPVGGVVAALAAGNSVILKPATVAAPVAALFAKAFFDAGVPKDAFQVVITTRDALKKLTTSPIIKHIILTGGTETAQAIAKANPITPLSAETGGKNAMILTASGDRDKAIMNVVASAFGNAGQKCSACSLFLVEKTVYDDPTFKLKMIDCATSLKVGSVWEKGNMVGPMITNQNDKLLQALATLEKGESWLVAPRFLDESKYILAPTIKWGVHPENFSFKTELFGPMLSVCRVENLEEAIQLVNSLDYGLTSGLQSLDESEQAKWKNEIVAGNLYINRSITGAIVNRQPFGGMKLSAFGGGLKAGGPNYCTIVTHITDSATPVSDYKESYRKAYEEEFSKSRDINKLYGEQNVLRYLPVGKMVLRMFEGESAAYAQQVAYAASLCKTPLSISVPTQAMADAIGQIEAIIQVETLEAFINSMPNYERIRTCTAELPLAMYQKAASCNQYIATATPVKEGRIELIHYLKEQSITFEYHRYGSITEVPASDE
ncbi:MAG: bifunctional proline dehydrogenase/L-glutamate gamma-semialdehyde dehydrogenase [Phocaeicola sp.]